MITSPRRVALGLLRAAARRRWLLAAGLAAASVATALPQLAPAPVEGTVVLVAAHDLAGGAVLTAADLARVELPTRAVPQGAVTDAQQVQGRAVAGAVRQGEPLTDVRLVGPGLLDSLDPALVAVPVRLADPAEAALLRAGDRVDVLAASAPSGGGATSGAAVGEVASASAGTASPASPAGTADTAGTATLASTATVVASAAPVLAVPARDSADLDGALVVVAAQPSEAAGLAAAAVGSRLSVVLRR